jgi:UDP-glucose 4-epimerase
MNVLITGGNGYIASNLALKLVNVSTTSINRSNFNLCDAKSTSQFLSKNSFDVVIHTAVEGGSRLKQDSEDIVFKNISMYYNIIENRKHFGKLITFGSGSEIFNPHSPYGMSKRIIYDLMQSDPYFYNMCIFAVFGHNELPTRFIKNNITNYINKKDITIHQDKFMDFVYMDDLVQMVQYYIDNPSPPKVIDCCYNKSYKLSDIANCINRLDNHTVPIKFNTTEFGNNYTGNFTSLPINLIGLEQGIIQTYKMLK